GRGASRARRPAPGWPTPAACRPCARPAAARNRGAFPSSRAPGPACGPARRRSPLSSPGKCLAYNAPCWTRGSSISRSQCGALASKMLMCSRQGQVSGVTAASMTRSDVIILGGGLIGLALAAALDSSGPPCIVVDPVDPESWRDAKFDGRTSAVSSSSRRMLDTIGVGAHFPEPGCPIRTIRVADGLAPGSLAFEPPEGDDEPLGWMHENRHLREALRARAEAGANIAPRWKSRAARIERGEHGVMVQLDDGGAISAPLLAVAEGRNSPSREAAGMRIARRQYEHAAIVSHLPHRPRNY